MVCGASARGVRPPLPRCGTSAPASLSQNWAGCEAHAVRPRKDHRGVDLISDVLPFGLAILPPFTEHFALLNHAKTYLAVAAFDNARAIFAAVEMKGSSPTNEILISYGNLADTRGRPHSVQLVLHPDGSVTWRDLTHHIR